jgi:hypothetical protein
MTIPTRDGTAMSPTTEDVREQLARLESEIVAQHRRIKELESQRPSLGVRKHGATEQPSRRDLLRRAGLAAAGAAGGLALLSRPAFATQDSAVLAGNANSAANTTELHSDLTSTTGFTVFKGTTSGSSLTFYTALHGDAAGPSDAGVVGTANASGSVSSTTGYATAVLGQTTAGIGVYGDASSTTDGIGIYAARGGRAPFAIAAKGTAGPPTTNAHAVGDFSLDSHGVVWVCMVGGTPGVFAPLQTGGANLSHFAKVSNDQYTLAGSDGATWLDMDATKLKLLITPAFNAQAIISVSCDLWTEVAGLNQDIGIYITGGGYGPGGAGKVVAWKESGGNAGIFSPNAAFVETTQPLVAGTAYTIKVRWKTNHSAGAGKIHAGAGPLPAGSAGGGTAGQVSPTRLAAFLVQDVPNPAKLTTNNPLKAPARIAPRALAKTAH